MPFQAYYFTRRALRSVHASAHLRLADLRHAAAAGVLTLGLLQGAEVQAQAGSEFQVNTATAGSQSVPAVAMDADGDFVVVWNSFGQDGSAYGVYAQRYNALGVAQGREFRVNTTTVSNQARPTVAMDADGDFVIVWDSYLQDGSAHGVYARRYNALGIAQGGEFQVNTYTTNSQFFPDVAMDADGDFVVTWESFGQDNDGSVGIYAQRYHALGAAQGSEFRVNTYTTNDQREPAVAMDDAGNFVVVWRSLDQDGSGSGIYGRRFNATGLAQGRGEFRANTFTTGTQSAPEVAMDANGDFVVVWDSNYQDGSSFGVYAQRYNAAGVAQRREFRVNGFTTNSQSNPSVAMDANGGFVVAWQSLGQDGSGTGLYARRYNAVGRAQGRGEFRVNTYTTNNQYLPDIALDETGDYVVTWVSYGQDGSAYGIYAQRYTSIVAAQSFVSEAETAPTEFGVSGIYPNPFTMSAEVALSVAVPSAVRVEVYDVLGRRVSVLHDGTLGAGRHTLHLDGHGLPSGVYVVQVQVAGTPFTQRVTLLR